MVGYVTLGTNDPARALRFYDELLALLGAKRIMEFGSFVMYGTSLDAAGLAITTPHDKSPATVGNGVMVALRATSKAQVDAVHRKALELGAKDEGPAGPRGDGFYAGYFRDLDGNKLNVFFM
jgi:catechol 2,3-dioxygenase-like lactoylglutathione lyase family enzyme